MLVKIAKVLTGGQVAEFRALLDAAEWSDGRATAGYLSSKAKNNMQLAEDHPVARKLGDAILDVLDANELFVSAALPLKVLPPLFNRYAGGQSYGDHIDGAVRPVPGRPHRVRTDLSATLFLSAPEEYDGGELVVNPDEDGQRIKLAAGDMVLYPGGSVHHIEPVTGGVRVAAFFWIQSMVRNEARRDILFAQDQAIQALSRQNADHAVVVKLAGVYHNLLREWADT